MEDSTLFFCNKCRKSFNHKIKLAVHKKYHHKTKHSSSDRGNDDISFEFYLKDMPLWKFSKADNNKDAELKIKNPKTPVAIPTKRVSSEGQHNQLEQIQTRSNSQVKKRGRDIDADNEIGPQEKPRRSEDSVSLASTEIITDGSNSIALPSSSLISKNPMDPSPKQKSTLKRMERKGMQTMVTSYKCSYCDYASAKTSSVKTHERVHTGEKPFKCRYCDHSAKQLSHMKKHERTHTGERPYKCGSCDFTTATNFSLVCHLRIHTGEKPYKCRYCDHRTIHLNDIKRHERIHTGERPYKCGSCDFTTTRYFSLACHLMIHTGEKPYKCRYCDHRAIKSSSIKTHERIHTGERPYKCGICDFTTKAHHSLTSHLKIHAGEKPNECASCDFTAKTSRAITRHPKEHLAEKQSYT